MPPPSPSADPRAEVERHARALLGALAEYAGPLRVRVAAADGRVACLVQVWAAGAGVPTAAAERRRRAVGGRADCRRDVTAAVAAAGRPLTRKQVVKALRAAGIDHGGSTVAKALADLTHGGELVNPRDRRGYRLPDWVRAGPTLFG